MKEREEPGKPWGLLATAGFGGAVLLLWPGMEAAVLLAMATAGRSAAASEAALLQLFAERGGLVLSLATLATGAVTVGTVLGLAGLRRSISIGSYLALRKADGRELLLFLGLALLTGAAADGITWLSGRPVVPEVMAEAYLTARFPLLYWAALVLAAPLSEEFLFRGFLFKGILHSKLGPAGAIFVTALVWALVHRQYESFYLVIVFVIGLLLGFARLATGSLVVPLAMHATLNLAAVLETFFSLRAGG